MRHPALIAVMFLVACGPAPASPPVSDLASPASYEGMTGALTINLVRGSDSFEVRLASLDTPVPEQTREWLEAFLADRQLRLHPAEPGTDRYGRLVAQVFVEREGQSVWLQEVLLEAGLARVFTYREDRAYSEPLLLAESEARQAGAGFWRDPSHAVLAADPNVLAQHVGEIRLVSGRVRSVTRLGSGRTYINFGPDWRSDFTIMISEEDIGLFDAETWAASALEGRRVRIRGRIVETNGPMIRLDHPERLEVLED